MENKRYYTTKDVMAMFGIRDGNYTTFGRICRDLKLPRMKVGKALLFPIRQFDLRMEAVEKQKLRNFNIQGGAL